MQKSTFQTIRAHHHTDVYADINETKKNTKQKMLRQDFESIFESRRAYGTAVSGVVIHLKIHLNHSQSEQLVWHLLILFAGCIMKSVALVKVQGLFTKDRLF